MRPFLATIVVLGGTGGAGGRLVGDDRVPSGFVGEDELVVVSHAARWPPEAAERAVYLGYLFVEPRRHAAGLADKVTQWPGGRAAG